MILTHAVQVLLCGPSEDELRCTQSHSTVGCMLTYVVQVSLCMPSEGGTEVYSVYSEGGTEVSHSTCDADLCCAGIAVHAIRGWN